MAGAVCEATQTCLSVTYCMYTVHVCVPSRTCLLYERYVVATTAIEINKLTVAARTCLSGNVT